MISKRIYIVGFMGVGKSTVGKKLARLLGYNFYDTDRLLENKYKIGIDSFFSKYGEELFRKFEHQCLEETFSLDNCIISTGGGLPCYFDAMTKINNHGTSVFLEMDEKTIYNRLVNSKQKRPLVMNLSSDELRIEISDRLSARIQYYSKASITIPAMDIDFDKLMSKLKS